jgi:hypothetical protein
MMSQTYESICEQSQQILYRERYNIMCSLERGLSDKARFEHGKRYGTWVSMAPPSDQELDGQQEEEPTQETKEKGPFHFYFEMETISDTTKTKATS